MILPTKHLGPERALLTIGARILAEIKRPITVSALWDSLRAGQHQKRSPLSYEWFILALDLLYMVGAITYDDGVIARKV